ncbi:hypothetical protein CBS101457_006614 [Exobasidium rhododendri]|nr:hypothetical protein CBS101457_006614 [Exobasidium rhododendri]
MLRSSKEGRKQAARFHAFPPYSNNFSRLSSSSSSSSHDYDITNNNIKRSIVSSASSGSTIDSTAKSRPRPRPSPLRPPSSSSSCSSSSSSSSSSTKTTERHDRLPGRDLISYSKGNPVRQKAAEAKAAESLGSRESDAMLSSPQNDHSEMPVLENLLMQDNSADPTQMRQRLGTEDSSMEPGSDRMTDRTIEQHESSSSSSISSRPFDVKEKTPSGDKGEERSLSSPLSSPLTSHLDDQDLNDEGSKMKTWDEVIASLPLYAQEYLASQDDEKFTLGGNKVQGRQEERVIRKYDRFKPREVEGLPLSSQRERRRVVKTLKLVEAEETSSPRSKTKPTTQGPAESSSMGLLNDQGKTAAIRKARRVGAGRSVNASTEGKIASAVDLKNVIKKSVGRPLGSTKRKRQEMEQGKLDIKPAEGLTPRRDILGSVVGKADEIVGSFEEPLTPRRSLRVNESMQTPSNHDMKEKAESSAAIVEGDARTSTPRKIRTSKEEQRRPSSAVMIRHLVTQDLQSNQSRIIESSTSALISPKVAEKSGKPFRATWKKKVFLTSGLYSSDFKSGETSEKPSAMRKQEIQEGLGRGTARTRKSSAFPLPTDYGRYLLEERKDFRLPYSVSQEIDGIREKLEQKKKPPPYKHISQNRYVSRSKLPGEILICQCPRDEDCGDLCVNRQTEYLCHPKHCPCGERCTNIYFGKRKAVRTEVQWYGARGFGLKTLEAITKGGFIDEYRGEVIDFNEAVRRIRDHYRETGNYYFLMYDAPAGEMLDGGLKGNVTRFANHSCEPNCKVQKWLICGTDEQRSGEFQVALFAERDIAPGEELTYDYGWSAFAAKAVSGEASSSATPEECHCGAVNCSGFLGVKKSAMTGAASALQSRADKREKRKKRSRNEKKRQSRKQKTDSSKSNAKIPSAEAFKERRSKKRKRDDLQIRVAPQSITATPINPSILTNRTPIRSKRRPTGGPLDSLEYQVDSPLTSLCSSSTTHSIEEDARGIEQEGFSYESSLSSANSTRKTKRSDADLHSDSQRPVDGQRRRENPSNTRKRKSSVTESQSSVDSNFITSAKSAASPLVKRELELVEKADFPVVAEKYRKSLLPNKQLTSGVGIAAAAAPQRLKVKDRVIRVLVRVDADEKEDLILSGKRQRRLSQKAADQASEASEKAPRRQR